MPADLILDDNTVTITDGTLISETDSPVQASFRGPDNTRIEVRSGQLRVQGKDGDGRTTTVLLSPALLGFVQELRAGLVTAEKVHGRSLQLGPASPSEDNFSGELTVDNARGNTTVRIDGRRGDIRLSGDVSNLSDARCKEDVTSLTDTLEQVARLRGVSFRWKDGEGCPGRTGERHIGLIAQEVLEVVPEVVREDSDGRYSVRYAALVPVLVEAIKEQQQQLERQDGRLAEMERRIAALETVESTAL